MLKDITHIRVSGVLLRLVSEREPENAVDKYSVCVKNEDKVVGRFPLEKNNLLFSESR